MMTRFIPSGLKKTPVPISRVKVTGKYSKMVLYPFPKEQIYFVESNSCCPNFSCIWQVLTMHRTNCRFQAGQVQYLQGYLQGSNQLPKTLSKKMLEFGPMNKASCSTTQYRPSSTEIVLFLLIITRYYFNVYNNISNQCSMSQKRSIIIIITLISNEVSGYGADWERVSSQDESFVFRAK